jgi:alkylation response protein AidB-like acyl-CoA dehydrogenase
VSFTPLFPGMLLDAASRYAQDHAGTQDFSQADPIAEMGWACTLVPEDAGGVGGTLADLASVVEGIATHGVHLPVIETCAIAPILLRSAAPETAARWLAELCEGSVRFAPLTALAASPGDIVVRAKQLDIGYELTGTVQGVEVSLPATHWLVPAVFEGTGDIAIFLLDAERLPTAATYRTMEGRRGADFVLEQLTLPAGACLARGAAVGEALLRAEEAALLLTGVDTVASLATLIRQTVNHLKERRQFGVALSTFQVLRHRTADMYVRYLAAEGLLKHALAEVENGAPGALRTLRVMKLALAESARACAESAIQMHGGMGVSEEVLATRLAQRLITSEFRYGDRLTLAARLLAPAQDSEAAAAAGATPQSRSAR